MPGTSLRVIDLSVRLGGRTVLSGITFGVEAGSMLVVLGPNGSGKSTLLRSLLGLAPVEGGVIEFEGRPVRSLDPRAVGYIPQIKSMDRTFPARAEDLIASALLGRWPLRLGAPLRTRIRAGLSKVGAEHLAGRALGSLSGGELQRVYLARALICSARVLILDEPETGIDAVGSADLQAQLDAYRRDSGGTVIMVTHDWDVALHHASHVLLLRNRQIAFGPPSDALTEDCVRAAFGHVGHAHAMVTGSHG